MTEIERLFLDTLRDIERRISNQDPYEILLISGLIRKLMFDDYPIINQVNRNYKLKLKFEITVPQDDIDNDPNLAFWSVQDGLDPDTASPFKKRKFVSRDEFIHTTVTVINGKHFSIKDIVLFESNVCGGIHAGAPKSDKDYALNLVGKSLTVGGYSPCLRQLLAIARVILKSCDPLKQKIKESI
jgi:hypothetical protein